MTQTDGNTAARGTADAVDGTDGYEDRVDRLRVIVDALSAGRKPREVKKEFEDLIRGADAYEVASLEQSLIQRGMPVDEVLRLCDVHADVFRAGLESGKSPEQMPGHPVHTYLAENQQARVYAKRLFIAGLTGSLPAVRRAAALVQPVIRHYERKENQLFPYLERAGFTGPSKVMWGKHDEVRQAFRDLFDAVGRDDRRAARRHARVLARKVRMMLFMEEKILFPNALKLLSELDWARMAVGEHAIGFAWVKPGSEWDPVLVFSKAGESRNVGSAPVPLPESAVSGGSGPSTPSGGPPVSASPASSGTAPGARLIRPLGGGDIAGSAKVPGVDSPDAADSASASVSARRTGPEAEVPLSVGSLPLEVLDGVLRSLPLDISFVDAQDKVRYYSDSPDRVFPRSPAVIGRDVHDCHPPKSVEAVERILRSFRSGEKDSADFWIQRGGKFIVISYKPIRSVSGEYLGTLEMSWDATGIRALDGERRLLDW